MEAIELVRKLGKSLTIEQKCDVISLARECIKLGATTKQIAPFFALYFTTAPTLTKEEMEIGQRIGRRLRKGT